MNICHKLNIFQAISKCGGGFVTKSCPTLCDPMDCSPPASSVHGILQASILEWGAMPSSRGSSPPRDRATFLMPPALAGRFLPPASLGKPSFSCTAM